MSQKCLNMCVEVNKADKLWLMIFQVSLTEAEEKYELAIESCVQLEKEKSELMSDVNALQGSVQELEKELSEMRMRHDELATVS